MRNCYGFPQRNDDLYPAVVTQREISDRKTLKHIDPFGGRSSRRPEQCGYRPLNGA